jgi:hypothetical protein
MLPPIKALGSWHGLFDDMHAGMLLRSALHARGGGRQPAVRFLDPGSRWSTVVSDRVTILRCSTHTPVADFLKKSAGTIQCARIFLLSPSAVEAGTPEGLHAFFLNNFFFERSFFLTI